MDLAAVMLLAFVILLEPIFISEFCRIFNIKEKEEEFDQEDAISQGLKDT